MKLVEYNDSYAAKLADMWNKSGENWGNDDALMTASDVVAMESSSGNIKLYLAIDNEEVVGYCSFSEYAYDEGASYLPLLNVRPDYHGKKIGKALILKVLEHAIVSEWSRFDLFTWSGNIKAMPLYKKCGFFWEKRNSSVHLMNFIPYMYQTEAIKGYLKQLDWYKDSKRVIDMSHDGITKRDFEFYRYDFENEQTKLSLEFEKTGRGLTYLDTPDYEIEMTVDAPKLCYGETYEFAFHITNKSDKDLNIELTGINNKNIETNLQKEIKVVNKEIVKGKFFLGETKKDQEESRTHPVVEVNVLINGLRATFKTGIYPKPPVNLKLNVAEFTHVMNREYTCYLNVENNLDQEEIFEISLPKNFVNFKNDVTVKLSPNQKKSLPIKYTLDSFGLYRENAKISFSSKTLEKEIDGPFFGYNQSFGAIYDNEAILSSGKYLVRFYTDENRFIYLNSDVENRLHNIFTPRIGKPFNLELSQSKPEITFPNNHTMKVQYQSKSFQGVRLNQYIINKYGTLEFYYELTNQGTERELSLSLPLWHNLTDFYVPYDGKLLEIIGEAFVATIHQSKIDGNWFYNQKRQYGFMWDKDIQPKIQDWKLSFDFEDILLKKGEAFTTPKFYISFDFPTLKEFRDFAGSNAPRTTARLLEPKINDGNPFVSDDLNISIQTLRKTQVSGKFFVDDLVADYRKSIQTKPGLKTIRVNLEDRNYIFSRLSYKLGKEVLLKQQGNEFLVDNGVLKFKASKDYSDCIYSLIFNGNEWLDSNYPEPTSRAWWGKYVGGIVQRAEGYDDIQALQEKYDIDFVELKDNFGNLWKGIKTKLINKESGTLENINIETYCLTLPNVPVVHSFSVFTNKSGKVLLKKNLHKFYSLKISDSPKEVKMFNDDKSYHCNHISVETKFDKFVQFESEREYKLSIYSGDNELLLETQPEYLIAFSEEKMTFPDGQRKKTHGDFLVFTKEKIHKDTLKDLENIKFNI